MGIEERERKSSTSSFDVIAMIDTTHRPWPVITNNGRMNKSRPVYKREFCLCTAPCRAYPTTDMHRYRRRRRRRRRKIIKYLFLLFLSLVFLSPCLALVFPLSSMSPFFQREASTRKCIHTIFFFINKAQQAIRACVSYRNIRKTLLPNGRRMGPCVRPTFDLGVDGEAGFGSFLN